MRKLSIFGLPFLVAVSAALSGPLVAPPKAAAYDDDDYYRDRYRDLDDDDDALGSDAVYGYFREELLPYGEWVRVPTYGWAWRPYNVGANWQPYTLGRWIDTDYGWTWVSDEPWGRSPYHYGRWYWDRRYGGWVWVPGRRWAPAWVDWREGSRYWGWAPLPPTTAWQPGVGIPTRTIVIEPRHYCFVEKRHIVEPEIRRYIAPPAQNVTIIHDTTNVTNYAIVNRRVANHSIREESVEKAIGRQVPRYPVAEVERAAPRAFHKEDLRGAPARSVEQNEARRSAEPPAPAERNGREQVDRDRADEAERADRDRRLQAERERQDAESRERARLDHERQDRERQTTERAQEAERQRDATREREAAREADVQRQRAADQQHDLEMRERQAREQEAARRQAEAERSREAAHRQAVQQQEAARARAERGKAEQEAARQQAEAERRRAAHPQPQPQAQSQPKRQQEPDPRNGH